MTTTVPAGYDELSAAYQAAVADAIAAVGIMRHLPPSLEGPFGLEEHLAVRELAEALERVIDAARQLDLPRAAATRLLQAIAAGGQS